MFSDGYEAFCNELVHLANGLLNQSPAGEYCECAELTVIVSEEVDEEQSEALTIA